MRAVRLTPAGHATWRRLMTGPVDSPAAGLLARRVTDAGLAHPCPPPVPRGTADVTIVVPVRDRTGMLNRCLAALDGSYPVIVVDDGSEDAAGVAAVAAAHGATLVRRRINGGPAAARNTGLRHVTTALVAYVDSDCVPEPGWIERLAGHFADPLVALAAPRITAVPGPGLAQRYAHAAGSLDMGEEPARVAPNARVSYVPTAAILARRSALLEVGGFDDALRVGEDVDLVWRLHEAGARVRYDPAVRVKHHEPATVPAMLARRARYGGSAAPLGRRHPHNVPPLVLEPWAAATVAALLARRPIVAGAAFALSVLATRRTLRGHDLPTAEVAQLRAAGVAKTWLGVGRYATRHAAPLLAGLALAGGRERWGRRAAVAALVVAPGAAAWLARKPAIGPLRFIGASVADDLAYGAGVLAGCVRHRTLGPLRPTRLGRRGPA